MSQQDFYIGWMAKAPKSFVKHVKRVLLILFPVALIVAYLLSTSQKKFSTANFEFGKLTEIKGIYYNNPVPMLKVFDKNNLSITIPLVGYGKHGAETTIVELEKEKGVSLNGKEVTLKGTLIYGDGKTLLQVDKNDDPIVNIGAESMAHLQQKDLSTQTQGSYHLDVSPRIQPVAISLYDTNVRRCKESRQPGDGSRPALSVFESSSFRLPTGTVAE